MHAVKGTNMENALEQLGAARLWRLSKVAAAVVALIGTLVLAAWVFDLPFGRSMGQGQATMKANTAACFLLSGVAVWLLNPLSSNRRRRAQLRFGAAGIVLVLCFMTLCEHHFEWDLWIDRLLPSKAHAPRTPNPGRMSSGTALAFVLLGTTLILQDMRRARILAEILTLCVVAIGSLGVIGYAFGPESLYGVPLYASMALHTAVAFVLAGLGIWAARPEQGLLSIFISSGSGGIVARRLFPVAVTIPMVVGWLRLQGERAGWVDGEAGVALFTLSNIILLAVFVMWCARTLDGHDAERTRLENALRESEETFRLLVRDIKDYAIFMLDPRGRVATWNAGAESIKGYRAADILGRDFSCFYPADEVARDAPQRELDETRTHGRTEREGWRIRNDGSRYWANVVTTALRNDVGELRGFVKVIRDITERKRAEEMFQLAVESAPSAMIMVNAEGRIVMANALSEHMFGYSRKELLARSVESLIPERFRASHPGFRAGFLADPHARAMGAGRDLLALHKDGSEFPVEIGLAPVETRDGQLVLSSVVDISERKRAEEKFRLAVESAPSAMIMVDSQGAIVMASTPTERLFGYTRDEMLGQPIELLVPDRFRDKHPEYRAVFMVDPRARPMGAGRDLYARRQDGSEFPVEIGLTPIQMDEGPAVLTSVVDITERRKAQQEILRLNADLEQRVKDRTAELKAANTELEAFSYSVSHDLRAPLRAIDGFSRILVEEFHAELSKEAQEYLQDVRDNTGRMGTLVDDLLAFSQLGRAALKLQAVAPGSIAHDCWQELSAQYQERRINWEMEDLLPCVADPALLKQVWMNLIANALKYTQIRDVAHIRVGNGNSTVPQERTYYVSDNGVGFDMRYADKLFGVFQRLHRAEDYEGTGVGLANVKRIIDRHGGRVWAQAQPNSGATFFFTLRGTTGHD